MMQLDKLDVLALLKLREAIQARIEELREKLTSDLASLKRILPKTERRTVSKKRPLPLKKAGRPAKFRDPNTGATWAGVGLLPRWLRAYEAEGKSRDEFAIGQAPKPQRRGKQAA